MAKEKTMIEAINTSKLLSLSEKRVLIGIVSFWSKGKVIYASYTYLSDNWGISESSVKRAFNLFKKNNVIDVENRKGRTNLVKPKMTDTELKTFLNQTELRSGSNEPPIIQNDPLDDKNELRLGQDELSGEVNKTYNTIPDTDANTDNNIETNNDHIPLSGDADSFLDIESLDFNESDTPIGRSSISTIDEVSSDLESLRNVIAIYQSNGGDLDLVFQQYHTSTRRRVVGYGKFNPNRPTGFYLDFKHPTEQQYFDREKFLLVDTENGMKEIVSNYL